MNEDSRKYAAAAVLVGILIVLILYLTFIPVPASNRDIIISILSVLVGAGSMAIPKLIGSESKETEELRAKVQEQSEAIARLQTEYATVKEQYDKIVKMLIERHVVEAKGIET